MNQGLFVTGTDTDCGKTHVAAALIRALRAEGRVVAPFKPVAAGAGQIDGEWRNDDALALIDAAGGGWGYPEVNPFCYAPPISPHLAALEAGVPVSLARIQQSAKHLAERSDFLLVEGAGGWMVPLDEQLDIADLAMALDLPVLLVVGLRLGCLNHARLSEQAVLHSGARLLGWVATQVDPHMQRVSENLETLKTRLCSPCLGFVPWGQGAEFDMAAFGSC